MAGEMTPREEFESDGPCREADGSELDVGLNPAVEVHEIESWEEREISRLRAAGVIDPGCADVLVALDGQSRTESKGLVDLSTLDDRGRSMLRAAAFRCLVDVNIGTGELLRKLPSPYRCEVIEERAGEPPVSDEQPTEIEVRQSPAIEAARQLLAIEAPHPLIASDQDNKELLH